MINTTTKSWKKTPLSPYVLESDGTLTPLSLIFLGITAALFHQHLRLGLNLPGHHGLEWMMLLLFGRLQSKQRWAGVLIAIGAASAYVTQSAAMPLAHSIKPALVYMLNGVCLDLLIRTTPVRSPIWLKSIVLGGLTFAIKPALLVPIGMLLGTSFGSFDKHGYLYPVLTHFTFGTAGAFTGIALASILRQNQKQ